jgi:hypothetical protein
LIRPLARALARRPDTGIMVMIIVAVITAPKVHHVGSGQEALLTKVRVRHRRERTEHALFC